jgi:2-oxoglutarate dehydrogenase complex dihydrolipoamide succinyltransferase (E2) component
VKVTVVMPQLGESIAEGEVVVWLKKAGDSVERDEALVEVKTDKATVEVPATASGTLSEILAGEGETVAVGAKIAVIEASSERAATAVERPSPQAREVREARRPRSVEKPAEKPPVEPLAAKAEETTPSEPEEGIRMTPLARRLIREKGIDPAAIKGSGASGRITREDVLAVIHEDGAEPAKEVQSGSGVSAGPDDESVPLSGMRRRIAARLLHSIQTIPHVTTVIDVDMTGVNGLRRNRKEAFEKAGLKLTFLPFIMKATVLALKEFPELNSSWGGDKLVLHKRVNLGIAVAVEGGLAVPVIRDTNEMSVRQFTKRLSEVAEHARAGKLSTSEARGGTFTITNPGMFGAVFSTPIINPPEAAILGVCRIAESAVAREGKIAVRWMTHLCLSYDHRIVDGEKALRFLQHMRATLEAADFDLS